MTADNGIHFQHYAKRCKAIFPPTAWLLLSIAGLGVQSLLTPAKAYQAVEMEACMKEAINSTAAKGVDYTARQLQGYCHCALTLIIDEGQGTTSSIKYCIRKYL